jgi:uncharacterized protein (DUF983 family)
MPDGHATTTSVATTSVVTAHGHRFTCGGCGHVFWRKFTLIYDPCRKCGQHVSSITKMEVRYR